MNPKLCLIVLALVLLVLPSRGDAGQIQANLRFHWVVVAEGKATHYGDYFSTGEHFTITGYRYHRDAGIVALPRDLYKKYQHYELKITNLDNGIAWMLRVEDTGLMAGDYVADLPDATFELFGVNRDKGVFPCRIEVGVVK